MDDGAATAPHRQPLLHDAVVTLHAPEQAWSRPDGTMSAPVDGLYVSDVRVLAGLEVRVGGAEPEHIATSCPDAGTTVATWLSRSLDDPATADPDVLAELHRTTDESGTRFELLLRSRLPRALSVPVRMTLRPCADAMAAVKEGAAPAAAAVRVGGATDAAGAHATEAGTDARVAGWEALGVSARLVTDGRLETSGDALLLDWTLEVPAGGEASASFAVQAHDPHAVVAAAPARRPWRAPEVSALPPGHPLFSWLDRALGDLDALRLTRPGAPDEFIAAGAPWFLTLFGRDAIWAALLTLQLDDGLAIARGTLRVLAGLQGTRVDVPTAEQPGRIPHELRRTETVSDREGFRLPPLYYGTIDATPLWITLLHEASRAGLPDAELAELRPALEAGLAWMRDHGDADGDGLLEYLDETGHGLANQGWKDSGDSVRLRDGSIAEGPVALCEVQGYAHLAALQGAELLERLGGDGAEWRAWAARLKARFAESFWVEDARGRFPAIALDARKRPAGTLTSNIGHLLGTGILDADDARAVAALLVSPELADGYGLRTLARDEAAYWPLGYHVGSVWAHDTAIAIRGLLAEGFTPQARVLAEGLLAASVAFDGRMPELYGGDPRRPDASPVPYPAACRPQAWSAAAAVTVLEALSR